MKAIRIASSYSGGALSGTAAIRMATQPASISLPRRPPARHLFEKLSVSHGILLLMGLGDQLIGSGLARGAAARGKRVAFGINGQIRWDHNSPEVFRGNPNIAEPGVIYYPPGALEWVAYFKGCRIYNRQGADRWLWNYDFRVTPGEVFFTEAELAFAAGAGQGFVVIEPNLPLAKRGGYLATNKLWRWERYEEVARALKAGGADVVQFVPGDSPVLQSCRTIRTPDFRSALAAIERAALYVGTEGGLHHGAAAVGTPAVVIFGGWLPPAVLGYPSHVNLTGGATEFCGLYRPCAHCRAALDAISVDEVLAAAREFL